MSVKEKTTPEDLILFEILRHPVFCAEFIRNLDLDPRYDEPFEFSWYQKEILCDFNSYVSAATARAVGKTVSVSSMLLWALVFNIFPEDYILYAVPNKVHLEPVFTELVKMFRTNSLLKHFIERGAGVNSSEYKISLLNHSTLLCRIAGQSGTGSNLIGLHTPFIAFDEGGYFPYNAYQEAQPSLNTWTHGFREVVTGVPTGMRENNVLYHADQENSAYTKHRVSAYDNPRITQADVTHAIEQYGGIETDDFIHYFLGQHGKPVFALFDRNLFKIESYPVIQLSIDGLREENFSELAAKFMAFPSIKQKNYGILFGIDLGYTEPTAIFVMYLDSMDRLRFHGKIKLSKVSYPIQEKLIDILDTKFEPSIIGMDEGNAGKSVRQHLIDDKEYMQKDYKKRLIPIDFSAWLQVGFTADGEEIKSKTKPFMVSILQDYTNNGKIVYSSTDTDIMSELERMTYTKNTNGDITYKTMTERGGKRGEDHFTSALLCGVGAYYLENELSLKKEKKILLRASWIHSPAAR